MPESSGHHPIDSSLEESHHEDKIYYCYRCEREFSSNELTANCIFCNEGFITEMTQSNFNSDEDSNDGRNYYFDYMPLEIADNLRNEVNDSYAHNPNSPVDNEYYTDDNNNGSDIHLNHSRPDVTSVRITTDDNTPSPHLRRGLRHVLEILDHINPSIDGNRTEVSIFADNIFEYNTNNTNIINELLARFRPIFEENQTNASSINNLPTIVIDESNIDRYKGDTCLICRADLALNDKLKKLPCQHEFHDDCAVTWLRIRDSCPVCRKRISE